jgi:glutamate-1-semialdehyde 2,1-aminomutase
MADETSELFDPARDALTLAVTAASEDYCRRNPRSREMMEAAARVLPGGNTRSSLWYDPFPLCMVRGAGCHLTDADGHEYLDLLGEFSAGIYGHSPTIVSDAIQAALREGLNLSSHNRWEGQLAALICARFPSMQLVRFTNSGTEANLMAVAAAQAAGGRRKILVFEGAYHGSVMSFPRDGNAINVPHEFIVGPYNDIDGTRALMEEHGDGLAAILVEPMLGAGGCIPGDPAFLRFLREASRQIGAVLVFDEIQTSRLSASGRQGQLGIEPDLTTLGKFFGGGLSFGCFGGRRDLMERFDPRRADALAHPGTFNNNTLTMAAGTAAVGGVLTAEALEALNRRGDRLRERVLEVFDRAGGAFTVTGLGSLMTLHSRGAGRRAACLRQLLFLDLVSAGVYLAARGFIALSLAVGDADVDFFLAVLESVLEKRRALYTGG